jgi:molybdopterin molybdotransferase
MSDDTSGFTDVTRLADALDTVRSAVDPIERTATVPLSAAESRVLAEPVEAARSVPHYERAAMDGYAVRASDTFEAGERSPVTLAAFDVDHDGGVAPGRAQWVHTGSPIPEGADAVVKVEATSAANGRVEVQRAVAEGENVSPVGEDVAEGATLFDAGHRLRPTDLALLKSVGIDEVPVYEEPTVAVIPTGEELVQRDPGPGEVVETNGFTVSRLVERWGGDATYRNVVSDDRAALRTSIQRNLTRDIVVTTGGSSVGERDLVPEIVDGLGEVLVHGLAIKPGHPAGIGLIEDRPVLMLPGYPVSTIVGAVQLLRPLLKYRGHYPEQGFPTTQAQLTRKLASEVGSRTFARVALDSEGGETVARPVRTGGASVLSSVTEADGWVVIPESREGVPAGETVAVQDWEYDE